MAAYSAQPGPGASPGDTLVPGGETLQTPRNGIRKAGGASREHLHIPAPLALQPPSNFTHATPWKRFATN